MENIRLHIQELFENIEESVWHGDEIISSAIKYVQEHIQEDITLAKVAGEVFCSPQYLSYLFKRITGENFSEYIIRVRIKNAQRLLVTTQYTVSEIANMVGIGNSSYFSKVFTKITGIGPARYRKNYIDFQKTANIHKTVIRAVIEMGSTVSRYCYGAVGRRGNK